MKYRAEIDGLRAVAVIPVILFHAGFDYFRGGFVGVDVFFVISGYLITTIILSEKQRGTFSLVAFYERRARRILPALFLVMLISLPFSWLWLIPSDLKALSRSLVAVSIFGSNFHFWQETGYWGASNELKPFLHTWSLAVEEQYYLIFPPFLILAWRFRRRWILGSLLLIATASLALSQWATYNTPSANFFLLPTRGWELAIGAVIAFCLLYHKRSVEKFASQRMVAETLSVLGVILIGYAIFVFDENVPFPGLNALVPVAGTGLIILFSSPETMVGRLLATNLLVGIGLLSYSAYLWHQPLLAFARYRSFNGPSQSLLLALVFLPFPLAYLSWRFVERPFRSRKNFSRSTVFICSAVGSIAFIAIGVAGQVRNGFPNRYSESQQALLGFMEYDRREAYREGACLLEPEQTFADFKSECFSTSAGGNTLFLWGDSHSGAMSYGLRANLHNVIQLGASGCAPLVDRDPRRRPHCIDINNYVLSKIEEQQPGRLLMHANWSDPRDGAGIGLKEALSRTIQRIKSISPQTRILVVGGVPQWLPSLPQVLYKYQIALREELYVHSQPFKEIESSDRALAEASDENDVTFLSLLDVFCNDEKCLSSVNMEGTYEPFAWDEAHLTRSASLLVAQTMQPYLDEIEHSPLDQSAMLSPPSGATSGTSATWNQ